jgi:hypothetical protein
MTPLAPAGRAAHDPCRAGQVGFVIPAWNAADTVLDTLAGLLRQTRADWRAVVVDDGSTDATAATAARVRDPRIRIVQQPNRGLAGARNTGWREVLGPGGFRPEFVCFLDADDVPVDRFSELALLAIGDFDAIAGGYRMVDEHLADLAWPVRIAARDVAPENLLEFNPLAIGAVLFRTAALARLSLERGPFDEHLRVHEDWHLFLRMARAGARWAPPIDADLMLYRQRPGSLTGALERMWSTGLDVIASSVVESAAARAAASRRWTLRHAARAAAAGDATLAARFVDYLGPLSPTDVAALVDAGGWGVLKHERIGPVAAARRAGELAARFAAALPPIHALAGVEPDLRRTLRALDIAAVARAAVARVGPGQRLVLYGLGRQGRAILDALRSLPDAPRLAAIDDDPCSGSDSASDIIRIRATDLSPRDIVLVTPANPGPILACLAGSHPAAAFTTAQLLEPPPAAIAG